MDKKYTFDKKIFAERIKTARKNRNLTQEALSALLNVNVNTVAKWESPKSKLTLSYTNLIELANILDIDIDYLFRTQIEQTNIRRAQSFDELVGELTDNEKNIVSNLVHSLIENRQINGR